MRKKRPKLVVFVCRKCGKELTKTFPQASVWCNSCKCWTKGDAHE